ncbi:hypothetical protein JCGZ_19088 [Jatropha curcas]|uniref:Uncharacterized protein n=1 Tax=Jatropha curcas TaxID=180498 RepID=A0A067JYW7_JATCU|nr:uncharacterized protein LOC105643628 [Jatropha curcas]KDP28008.1 hypothetical protein JCGZ_19088 [Jatropha curcas]
MDQSECGGCGGVRRWVLHNVRHRAAYRRLCTNCILKSHQGLFCPFCFEVYDESLPPHERLMCLKCPSISHLSCVPWSHPHSPPSFLCPACSTPNFSFFNLDSNNATNSGTPIDKDSARALLAGARIAAVSMAKAATVARVEAERRVKEAALAKKRAREALERLAYLAAKEKEMKEKDRDSKVATGTGIKVSNNNNKRILADGIVRGDKGSNGLHSVSLVVNVSGNAGQLKRQ